MTGSSIPWDVYVDEQKERGQRTLGFLVVPNTASFGHLLHSSRDAVKIRGKSVFLHDEVKWSSPHGHSLLVEERWLERFFNHKGARFLVRGWSPDEPKHEVVLKFLNRFCKQKQLNWPFNVVVFLDFDSDHARDKIQNQIRERGGIYRCYHVDSAKNDCIQLCDLLLGATSRLAADAAAILTQFPQLRRMRSAGDRLKDAEAKRYRAGLLASLMVEKPGKIVDSRLNLSNNE